MKPVVTARKAPPKFPYAVLVGLASTAMVVIATIVPSPWLSAVLFQVGLLGNRTIGDLHLDLAFGSYANSSKPNDMLGPNFTEGRLKLESLALFHAEGWSREPVLVAVVLPMDENDLPLAWKNGHSVTKTYSWGSAVVFQSDLIGDTEVAESDRSWTPLWIPQARAVIMTKNIGALSRILSIERRS